jgi:hypothetical protein
MANTIVYKISSRDVIGRTLACLALVSSQVLLYAYSFWINAYLVDTLKALAFFEQQAILAYLVHNPQNLVAVAFLVTNCLLTLPLIYLVYLSARKVKVGGYVLLLGLFLYVSTNLIGKALGLEPIRATSMDIYSLFSSPLITVCLLPALKLV